MVEPMKRLVSLLLCLVMVFGVACATAESSLNANENELEDYVPKDLTPEELAQWQEWADGEGETSDSTAANAGELSPEEEALMAELATMLEDETQTEVDLSNLKPNEALPDNVFNILLLGIDSRDKDAQSMEGRSDAVIICSINKDTGSVTLSSIARDTAVEVPGYKSRKRINTAYKFGCTKGGSTAAGAELAMKTVNRNFQMNIEHYVVVNIHGLAEIIQALGGVDMEMTRAEASAINYELFEKEPMDSNEGRTRLKLEDGVQHLDGMQAVTYGRIRNLKGQNDLNRNERQRHLLEVLLEQVMDGMDFTKLLTLIQTALPYGKTNLTSDELLELGSAVLSGEAMKNLQGGGMVLNQFSIPMVGEYGYREFGGVSLVYISERRMKTTLDAMHEIVYGQSYYQEK